MQKIWNTVCKNIEQKIGKNDFENWIKDLEFKEIQENTVFLIAKNSFIKEWVETHYAHIILNSFKNNIEGIQHIRILEGQTKEYDLELDEDKEDKVDHQKTFKNFIVGKSNEFAYAAALRVAESENLIYNPLFLYGGAGLGKTHLMNAIALRIKEIHPRRKVLYITAERFMYQFVKALRFKDTVSFKEEFRGIDVLMVDDVQFFSTKTTTQEEFFHTFNALIDGQKQIIISADKSPSDLENIEERLKSRMGWGLVADIHPTTYELRLGILQAKAEQMNIKINNKVLEFIAFKITSNVRELEGALNRIVAHSQLIGRSIDIETTQEILKDILKSSDRYVTMDDIKKRVCEYFGIKPKEIDSPKRLKNITRSRQVAMYLCKELTTKSFPEIGREFGGKDHSTVMYSIGKVKEMMQTDQSFSEDVSTLRKSLEMRG